MKPLVIFHKNCLDGFTAAWCAWRKFGDEADYHPAQYGDPPPPDVAGRDVLIVDFSYSRHFLLDMVGQAKSLRVLDHHKTAQAELDGLDFCLFDMDRSGAGLAWDELGNNRRTSPGCELVNYVEDRDLWRFALPHSKEINAFIGSFDQTFENWAAIAIALDNAPQRETVVSIGSAILRGVDRYVREMAKQAQSIILPDTWCPPQGICVPVVNAPYINTSELVGHLAEANPWAPFAVGWFQRGDGKYQYSLRSRGTFDVSEVAKRFGGGGHKAAAGFTSLERVDC